MIQLEPIGESIWLVEGDIVSFYGFPYPSRSIIVQLKNKLLWVWSPVGLTVNLRKQIDEIGRVGHLISPNKIHHLYLQDWKAAYPSARLWGPESTIRKRKDLDFQAPLTDEAPIEWSQEIDQFWFQGSPALDEIVFFHRASRTAILADLSENFSDTFLEQHWAPWMRRIARIWKIVEPFGYAPLELRAIQAQSIADHRRHPPSVGRAWWTRTHSPPPATGEAGRSQRFGRIVCMPNPLRANGPWHGSPSVCCRRRTSRRHRCPGDAQCSTWNHRRLDSWAGLGVQAAGRRPLPRPR